MSRKGAGDGAGTREKPVHLADARKSQDHPIPQTTKLAIIPFMWRHLWKECFLFPAPVCLGFVFVLWLLHVYLTPDVVFARLLLLSD